MKKFAVVLAFALVSLFFISSALAAQATVTATSYGYSITGGVSETRIAAGRINVKMIVYTASTANDIVSFRDGATSGTRWYMKSALVSGGNQCYLSFYPWGAVFDELAVTLAEVTDVVQIYI